MKKLIVLAALAVIVAPAAARAQQPVSAQTDTYDEKYLELARSDLKTQKKLLVTEAMALTDAQSETFWQIYREYEAELTVLGDEKLSIIKEYAENFERMTPEVTDELMQRSFKLDESVLKLDKKYYKQMSKALGPVTAARFSQVEHKIGLLIDLQVSSQIPLVH
jgi:hypothetical protein